MPKFSLLKFKTLIRNDQGPPEPVHEVLHTQEELDAYLEACQDPARARHPVAFPEERAVAVALGERRHGGHVAEIIAVVQETGGIVGVQHHVLYVEHVPHGPAIEPITYPHHVIRVRGLGGVVSFRQIPDTLGHSLRALTGPVRMAGGAAALASGQATTTLATGEEGPGPTTLAVGEEGGQPTTLATGEEGPGPTTLAVGEEAQMFTTLAIGEEGPGPTTLAVGEEGPGPTTLAIGEEGPGPTTLAVGEEAQTFTTLAIGEEGPQPTTLAVGEEGPGPTTLAVGEEGPGPTTLAIGEEGQNPATAHFGEHHLTTLALGEEVPTAHVGEHLTTLALGEEGPGPGGGFGGGPFG